MKFFKALFLLSALAFTFANNIEVSDDEGNNGFDAGFGNTPSVEEDHNQAPVEAPTSLPPKNIPSTSSPTDNSNLSSLPPKNVPSSLPPKNVPSTSSPSSPSLGSEVPSTGSVAPADVESANSVPGANVPGANGEQSDDYGDDNAINNVDNAPVPNDTDAVSPSSTGANGADVPGADGEGSDDYGDTNAVDKMDNANVNAADTAANGEASADENEGGSNAGGYVAAAAGAACASAGIFYWVKKSKRNDGYVQSVRTQISMV